jgi:hypothetical protein
MIFRTYRPHPRYLAIVAIPFVPLILGSIPLSRQDYLPIWVDLLFTVGLLAMIGLMYLALTVPGTTTSPEGLAVRTLLRSRLIPWSEIQIVSVSENSFAVLQPEAPPAFACVFDDSGRKILPPQVNPRQLQPRGLSLDGEVTNIHQICRPLLFSPARETRVPQLVVTRSR